MRFAGALLLLAGAFGLLAGEITHRAMASPLPTAAINGAIDWWARLDLPPVVSGLVLAIGLGVLLLAPGRSPRQRRFRFPRRAAARDPYFLRIWR